MIKLNDKKFFIKKKIIPLYKLKDWNFTPSYISHKKNKHFSIIGTKILTNKREVNKWCQPIIKGKDIKDSLIRQLENPVLWFDTIKNMANDNYSSFIEIGPGKVLQGLNRKIDKKLSNSGIQSHEDLITYEV